MRHPSRCPLPWSLLALLATAWGAPADEPQTKPTVAPGDAVIFERDMAGAFFIAKPLKDQYDAIQKRVAALKAEVREAKIDSAKARGQVALLQGELKELLEKIRATRLYIPGAAIRTRTETSTVPILADDLLLIDAEDVEIRGWDGPGIECVLEKTVLDEDGTKFDADLAGIELVTRKGSGREFFGYYADITRLPGGVAEWDRFPFQDYVKATFPYITLRGLTYQEGNRQIELKMMSEKGGGSHSSQWRRHARLVLKVPRCRKVAVRGALGRFRVEGLDASLAVLGEGNRDYGANYEVIRLGGSLKTAMIPIHRVEGIQGAVSIDVMAYNENRSSAHDREGEWDRSEAPKPSIYRDIRGDLKARFCRADLTLEKVGGRVDVSNDFGNTAWTVDAPLAPKRDHRVVTQSGSIEIRLDPKALGDLRMSLFTECGAIHLTPDAAPFDDQMFTTGDGDDVRRSWHSQVLRWDPNRRPTMEERFAAFRRPADALRGRDRSPGVDIVSRAGIITVSPVPEAKR